MIFKTFIRVWLIAMLFIIPVQRNAVRVLNSWNSTAASFVNYLDELTVAIFFLFAIIEYLRDKNKIHSSYYLLSLPPLLIFFFGTVSGIHNSNSLVVTTLGTYDYIKYYLLIFTYAAFFREKNDFKKIFKFLLIMTIFLGTIVLIQEFWAVFTMYILGWESTDKRMYFLRTGLDFAIREEPWRFGIYRATSLMHHPNYMGFYCLFILTIYLYISRKVNYAMLIPLVSGILLSASRLIYAGFASLACIRIMTGRRKILVMLIPILIVLSFMAFFDDFNINNMLTITDSGAHLKGNNPGIPYRIYTRGKAMEILGDHPFLGIGPGMFGGVVSVKYDSYVYDMYNFMKVELFIRSHGIDQFWPHLMAEMGIIGFLLYINLFASLLIFFYKSINESSSEEIKGLFKGLATFIMVIIIWTLGSGINDAVLFTFYAITGIGLGCSTSNKNILDKS